MKQLSICVKHSAFNCPICEKEFNNLYRRSIASAKLIELKKQKFQIEKEILICEDILNETG